ncbi:MAG: hypothetical protein AAF943_00790 [Pseudomonadota bacterium]
MRVLLALAAGAVLLLYGWAWASGGLDRFLLWAAAEQRAYQNAIAGALRSARAGEAGAIMALLGACFAYGLAHGAGPGHGKVLIGGYGFARRVSMLRLAGISVAASLMQAMTAVALVTAGILLFDFGREVLIGATEDVLAPVSYGMIALVGAWLIWRGVRRLFQRSETAAQSHHGDVCGSCGHAHGPSLEQVDRVSTLREALVLVGGIGVRPCTGALFVLLITWQMDIYATGVAGVFAMALGTALVVVFVGLTASGLRGSMLGGIGNSAVMARGVAALEVLAGGVVVLAAVGLLMRAL